VNFCQVGVLLIYIAEEAEEDEGSMQAAWGCGCILQENVIFLTQKVMDPDTCVR
jgi:hypothetical protein